MKNKLNFLSMLLALFAISTIVACSSDDDEQKDDSYKSWGTADMCIDLEACTTSQIYYIEKNVPYDYSSMRCYVMDKYYYMERYSNWYFTLPSGGCYYGAAEALFLEIGGKACMLLSQSQTDNVFIGSATDAYNHKCLNRVQLGSNNPSNPNYGGGSSGGSGGSSGGSGGDVAGFTLYKSDVTAKVFTEVNHKTTDYNYESVDIYKKGSNYYLRFGTYSFVRLQRNNSSTFGGVSVSGYTYFASKNTSSLSVNYYYFVKL